MKKRITDQNQNLPLIKTYLKLYLKYKKRVAIKWEVWAQQACID